MPLQGNVCRLQDARAICMRKKAFRPTGRMLYTAHGPCLLRLVSDIKMIGELYTSLICYTSPSARGRYKPTWE